MWTSRWWPCSIPTSPLGHQCPAANLQLPRLWDVVTLLGPEGWISTYLQRGEGAGGEEPEPQAGPGPDSVIVQVRIWESWAMKAEGERSHCTFERGSAGSSLGPQGPGTRACIGGQQGLDTWRATCGAKSPTLEERAPSRSFCEWDTSGNWNQLPLEQE